MSGRLLRIPGQAFQDVARMAHGDIRLDEEACFQLHRLLLRRSRFKGIDYAGEEHVIAMRIGALRGELAWTVQVQDESNLAEFGPPEELPELFKNMIVTANNLVPKADSAASTFALAAYLHYVLLSIHPFSDGNGRLGRLIASLPLLRIHGPPILITRAMRTSYLGCLTTVKATSDLTPLVNIMVQGAQEGMDFVERLPPLTDADLEFKGNRVPGETIIRRPVLEWMQACDQGRLPAIA